jgi:peroxiredoxin
VPYHSRGAANLLACAFLISSSLLRAAIAPNAEAVQPLKTGDHAPAFTALRADQTPYTFMAAHLTKPHVIIFYRGGWCPYCNRQLADLHLVEPKLRASGFEVLFLSTDRPELLYSSLKNPDISYTLLSDPTLQAAQAFHIAFHVDDETYKKELAWGVDLEKTTGTQAHALPVPSVFIVDTAGVIRFVYSNPDYRVRLSADDLWRAAQPLSPQTASQH